MAMSLQRVERIRMLIEEVARMTLAVETAELSRIESIARSASDEARQSRERVFAALEKSREGLAEAASDDWRTAEASWGIAVQQRERAEAERASRQRSVDQAMEEYLTRRRERRQVATLLAAAEDASRIEQGRREQHALDDWFQSRAAARATTGSPERRTTGASAGAKRGPAKGTDMPEGTETRGDG